LPLSFLDNLDPETDRQRFNEQIDELIDHACMVLATQWCFILLFEQNADTPVYVTKKFEFLQTDTQGCFRKIASQAIGAADAVATHSISFPAVGAISINWSLLTAHICNKEGGVIGSFIAARDHSCAWTGRDKTLLTFLANSASAFLQLKQSVFQFRKAEEARQNSERRFNEAEEKFSALARNVPGAIFRYIRRPGDADAVAFMSPGCVSIWGYTAEELECDPKLLWLAILPEDLEAMRASVQQSQDQLASWQHRWRIRSKEGFLKWLQAYGTPYPLPDGGVAWNTLILDVTVEQEAQAALAENSRLLHEAQKLDSIGRLAGGVAHDFNNLLSVIMGNAEAINAAALAPDEKEAIDEIVEASQRGAVLVKQLLSFARKSDLRSNVTDIHKVLVEVDRLLRRVLPANIAIEISQQAGLWPVALDRSMFESALLNIVINARDAMPEGGAITIETSNVRIDHEYIETRDEDTKPGRYVMVAVTDTGCGIDEAVLPYVFEPFFTTKGPNDGNGLGLAMVQGFVKQSGGIIRIYSELGHGTSVKMFFPAAQAKTDFVDPSSAPLPSLSRVPAGILLVEDQERVRRVIERTLINAGYRVITASSGDKAFGLYEQMHDEIDLIVTDVVMPGRLQGPQLVRLARKINQNLPVLYMSGYPHEANVHGNGVRAGDISLLKPVRRNDLLTAITKLRKQG
jgi:PAS domain S-box-containing protein